MPARPFIVGPPDVPRLLDVLERHGAAVAA
jgi:hypothetical protein